MFIKKNTKIKNIDKENNIITLADNKNIKFNYKKSIQIEVSNVKGTPKLIFEDNSMIYDVENIKLGDKEYCRVNLIEYDINLYLPTNIEIVTIN